MTFLTTSTEKQGTQGNRSLESAWNRKILTDRVGVGTVMPEARPTEMRSDRDKILDWI